MTVGLRLCSPARPLFPASLPVRVPTVESLSSALSFAPSRFRTSRLTTVAVIDSVGNSHPDSIGTCRAHERGCEPQQVAFLSPCACPIETVAGQRRRYTVL